MLKTFEIKTFQKNQLVTCFKGYIKKYFDSFIVKHVKQHSFGKRKRSILPGYTVHVISRSGYKWKQLIWEQIFPYSHSLFASRANHESQVEQSQAVGWHQGPSRADKSLVKAP